MRLRLSALAVAVLITVTGCVGLAYPSDDCVSQTHMADARRAQAMVLEVIPPGRVTEVIVNDGCNDSEEPSAVVRLKGLSNPLEPLSQSPDWQQVPSDYLELEEASEGVTRPFGWGHLVALWGPNSDRDTENKDEDSSLYIIIEGFSPVATPRPLG